MIYFIRQYLGWRHWAVLTYNSVIENIFLLFYIALTDQLFTTSFISDLTLFLLFSIFSTTYGYLINDLSDMELDRIHGKNNTFENDSNTKAALIVLLFLAISIIFGSRFIGNPLFLIIWICWGLSATFYSLRPVRLKERGKAGLLVVVLAQRGLPALLMFSAFRHYDWVDIIVFSSYIFFRGLSSDLNHQLADYSNDSCTRTATFAVTAGELKTQKVFSYSLELERALLLVGLIVMCVKTSSVGLYGLSLIIPVLIFYIGIYGACLMKIRIAKTAPDLNPFSPERKNIFQFMHHAFPSVVLPFYLLLLLVYENWLFLPVLLVFFLLKSMLSFEVLRNAYAVRKMTELMKG
jgi:4-hydroxybenzoate polyprenyltransferase